MAEKVTEKEKNVKDELLKISQTQQITFQEFNESLINLDVNLRKSLSDIKIQICSSQRAKEQKDLELGII